ncbi:MAG: hypothetical protein ACR2LM_18690 [Pyrinomonadaceae bacterium]
MTFSPASFMQALRGERLSTRVSFSRRLRYALLVLVTLCVCQNATGLAQDGADRRETCPLNADHYEREGYSVKSIRIETPLDFLGVVRRPLEVKLQESQTILAGQNKGLKIGEKFSNLGYIELLADLTNRNGTLEPGERFKFVTTLPSLRACDANAKTLEVVYWVVTSGPISYLVGFFEKRHDRLTREFAPGAFSRLKGKLLPQPYGGYNRSRAIFGGTKASYRFANDVKEATVLGQFFAATRPLGSQDIIMRFGSSIEGGNRQSDLDQNTLPAAALANSGYGAVKMYVGSTLNLGRQSWRASYGLQIGANKRGLRADYVKQLVDTSYSVRFLTREHMPLRLDAQFNAGHIHSSSDGVPVAERFFGGNSTREFIQGDDWQIRSSPFIRSFPQNRLGLTASGTTVGGEKFFSANVTLAQTVWARGAIPSEIVHDVRVKQALGGQLAGSRLVAIASYLSETPQFLALKERLKTDTSSILQDIQKELRQLNPVPDAIPIDLEEFVAEIETVRDKIAEREKDEDTGEVKPAPLEFAQIRSLAVGFNGMPETSKIGGISQTINTDILSALQEAGLAELHSRLKAHNDRLETSRVAVQQRYEEIASLARTNPQELIQAQTPLNEIGRHLTELGTILDGIEGQMTNLPANSKEELQNAFDRARSYVTTSKASVEAARGEDADIAKNNLHLLAIGFGPVAPAMLSAVGKYVAGMQAPLAAAGLASQGQRLLAAAKELPTLQDQMKDGLKRVTVSDLERKANQDVAYTARILDVTFRELNLIAVSPVVMFDVARLGPTIGPDIGGTRYGVGAGMRLSVVSLDLTAGYSLNPNRRRGEGRGALVFSLDISDLFR